jgi:DHA3 family macrolide efflux protein-like MFS transporter
MLVQYAILWYITLSTQSGAVLTLSILASFLPQIAISLFAGVWADRYHRKFLIISADILTAVSTLVLAISFLLGYQELWLIFLVAGIRSVGAGIQMPAVNALLPQIVPTEKLLRVNSINSTISPFIMIAAPIVSGTLMSLATLESIFFIDVVTAMIAVGLLLLLKVPSHRKVTTDQPAGYLDDLRAGLAYIKSNRTIRTLFIFFAFAFFLVTPAAFLSPLLVARSFGEEVWRLTANEITFFVGSILGGVIMASWGGFKSHFRTIGFSTILWAVFFTGLGLSENFILYLFFMFLSGVPMPMLNVPTVTLLQEAVAVEMQGRVFSVQQLITTIVMPVGMLVFGPLADAIPIGTLLVLASSLMAVPGVWIFLNRNADGAQRSRAAQDYDVQPGD